MTLSWRIAAQSLSDDGNVEALERVDLADTEQYNESWLQSVLDRHPDLVPLSPLHAVEGPLVSLGREIDTSSGPIDNLFVSPSGKLVVVEVKLWRNSESRRKVIAQILSYSEALSRMTFGDLDTRVRGPNDSPSIWERVEAAAPGRTDEAALVDTVSNNLTNARFILLIVGDGIRGDLAELTDVLTSQVGMAFDLDLIEVQIFQLPGDGDGQDRTLLFPHIVGKTSIVERIVVTTAAGDNVDQAGSVSVARVPNDNPPDLDTFFHRAAPNLAVDEISQLRGLFEWWVGLEAATTAVEVMDKGVWLTVSSPRGSVKAFWVGHEGIGEIDLAKLQTKHDLAAELVDEFAQAGFSRPKPSALPQQRLALEDAGRRDLQASLKKLAMFLASPP